MSDKCRYFSLYMLEVVGKNLVLNNHRFCALVEIFMIHGRNSNYF